MAHDHLRHDQSNPLPEKIIRRQRISLDELKVDETIFSIANGFLGTRGHFTEGYGHPEDIPRTFLNGFYDIYPFRYEENSAQFPQHGQTIVPLPDPTRILITAGDERIDMTHAELTELERIYDLEAGMTHRKATYQTPKGHTFILLEERLASHDEPSLMMTRLSLNSPDYTGPVTFTSLIRMPDIRPETSIDPRLARGLHHVMLTKTEAGTHYGLMEAMTHTTHLKVRVAMSHDIPMQYEVNDDEVMAIHTHKLEQDQPFVLTKWQIVTGNHTQNDRDVETILADLSSADDIISAQRRAMQVFWSDAWLSTGQPELDQALHYHMVQLRASGGVNEHLQIAAKGLSGEGYEGHYFWDTEIYMMPFFILSDPARARRLLMYRWHTLDQAREEARKLGVKRGAKIPWRTIDGTESSPYYPAGSAQIHINSDVAHAILQYVNATGDADFLYQYGFEMLVETALFLFEYGHEKDGQFHLDGVTGPDEYTVLVNDNYYTNRMAKRHFEAVTHIWSTQTKHIKPVLDKLGLEPRLCEALQHAADIIALPVDDKHNIVKQDSTFLNRADYDVTSFPTDKRPVLLHYHPLFIYRHQVLKQADALLSLVLLNEPDRKRYRNTFDYYLPRTTHDSSLSKCMYGIAAFALGEHDLAYHFMKDTCALDLEDTRRHTRHGLHVANMGGTWLMVAYGLFGIRLEKVLAIEPVVQDIFKQVELRIIWKQARIKLILSADKFVVSTDRPIQVSIQGETIEIHHHHEVAIKAT